MVVVLWFAVFSIISASAYEHQIGVFSNSNWGSVTRLELSISGQESPIIVFDTSRGDKPWTYFVSVTTKSAIFEMTAFKGTDSRASASYTVSNGDVAKSIVFENGPSLYILDTGKVFHNKQVWADFAKTQVFPRLKKLATEEMEMNMPKYWLDFRIRSCGTSLFILGDGFAQHVPDKAWLEQHVLRFKYKTLSHKSFHLKRFKGAGLFAKIDVDRASGTLKVKHTNLESWESTVRAKVDTNDLQIFEMTIPIPQGDSDDEDGIGQDPAASGPVPRLLVVPFASIRGSERFWKKVEFESKDAFWSDGRWNRDEIKKLWTKLRKDEPKTAMDNINDGALDLDAVDDSNRNMRLSFLGAIVLLAILVAAGCLIYFRRLSNTSDEDTRHTESVSAGPLQKNGPSNTDAEPRTPLKQSSQRSSVGIQMNTIPQDA